MTDIYKYLQKKSKRDVINFGKAYAYDKSGFVKFAEKNWNKEDGNYVRAIVSVASLLLDRPKLNKDTDLIEQVHALDYAFNTLNGEKGCLINPIIKFFDNGVKKGTLGGQISEIEDAYKQKINAYAEIVKLRKQIDLVDKQITPILGEDTIAKLKTYNRKPVMLSVYRRNNKTLEKEYKIIVKGSSPKDLSLQFNGNTIHVISDVGGVASIKDVDTGETIFKNELKGVKFSSKLEKYTHYYGFQTAIDMLAKEIKNASTVSDEDYRKKVKDKKAIKNDCQVKKVMAVMRKSDEDEKQ